MGAGGAGSPLKNVYPHQKSPTKWWFVFCNTFLSMAAELHNTQFLKQQNSLIWMMKYWLVFSWVSQMYVSTPSLRRCKFSFESFPLIKAFKELNSHYRFWLRVFTKAACISKPLFSWKLQELSISEASIKHSWKQPVDYKVIGSEKRTNRLIQTCIDTATQIFFL